MGGQSATSTLANAPPGMQKQMLGEKIFPMISRIHPEMAGKITGMMLEMDNSELLMLMDSPDQLKAKVDEALRVLQQGGRESGGRSPPGASRGSLKRSLVPHAW